MSSRRVALALAFCWAGLLSLAPGVLAQDTDQALRDHDARAGGTVAEPVPDAGALKRADGRLGDQAIVATDPLSGGLSSLGRSDGQLAGPAAGDPAGIALAYARSHEKLLGLDDSDIDALRILARYTSPDGVTHLTWQQTDHGIPSYDTFLSVNVADDGSIVNITGAPVHDLRVESAKPDVSRSEAISIAAGDVSGDAAHPTPVILADRDGDQLAWRVTATADDGRMYDEVIDAGDGSLLVRHSLSEDVSNASAFEYHPGAALGGTAHTVDLAAPSHPEWLNDTAGDTRLSGRNAHAYADVGAPNGFNAGEDIAASGGTDWLYPQTGVGCGGGQFASTFSAICTWSGVTPASTTEPTNRAQTTTQLFYFVNNYHDWLAQNPIGFNNASHNFEVGGTGGDDPVNAEADDSSGFNNANMSTPPDGQSPRMQMYLFRASSPAVNSGDDASVVYHEYTHGLTNRLVGNGTAVGLVNRQSRAMGEGWSDWYAMDYLVAHGFETDTAADGELPLGEYVTNNVNTGIRINALDCSVGSADATHCPGTSSAGPGGLTYGDMGRESAYNGNPLNPYFEVHNSGEIWAETLWDLRTTIGATTARGLITSALRLSPNNPTFLDMRDAILQADTLAGGGDHAAIWQVFANRGMGFSASTNGSEATRAIEAFDVPPLAGAGKLQVSDPPPLGDGDGIAEPGETVRLSIPVRNPQSTPLSAVRGTLSSTTPGVVAGDPSGDYGAIGAGAAGAATAPYAITIPTATSCSATIALNLGIDTGQGASSVPISLPLGTPGTTYTSLDVPKAIPDSSTPGATSVLNIPDAGTIGRMRVSVQATHSWVGDLHGTLTSPSGHTAVLFERIGPGQYGTAANGMNVTFDDGAASEVQDFTAGDTDPGPSGSLRPDQPLSTFTGDAQNGNWTLRMYDVQAPDAGSITGFSIQAGPSVCSTPVTPAVATTTPASGLTTTEATLNGTIDSAGAATDYAFDYGTAATYGQRTPVASAGSGSGAAAQSAAISGLSPNTTYHYQALALRAGNVVAVGGDQTFKTPDVVSSPPPDTTAPDTKIDSGPAKKTKKKQATFRFSSSEPGSTFQCALDKAAFTSCTSPAVFKAKKGKHTLSVRAEDAAGNVDASPAKYSWKVKKKKRKKHHHR